MPYNIDTVQKDVTTIQKEMAQVASVAERLDVSIEKLTELSTTMSQILAVQGNRLDVYEKAQEKLQDTVERRKAESDEAINKAYLRMERIEENLQDDMKDIATKIQNDATSTHNDIKTLFNDLKKDINDQNQTTNDRITNVERWMYGIAGGFALIVVLMASFDTLAAVF